MSAHEISSRGLFRDLVASLSSWQTWTGLNEANSKLRIGWPSVVVTTLPAIVVVTLAGGRRNIGNSDSSANFCSKGGLAVLVFDEVSNPADLMTSDTAFGTKFFGLIDDLVEHAHDTELMIADITYGDNPYRMDSLNSATAEDADADDEDDEASTTKRVWVGEFQIQTGVTA